MVGWLCAWCVVGLGWSGSAGWISEGAGVRVGWGWFRGMGWVWGDLGVCCKVRWVCVSNECGLGKVYRLGVRDGCGMR
jgi:hypothetical protein